MKGKTKVLEEHIRTWETPFSLGWAVGEGLSEDTLELRPEGGGEKPGEDRRARRQVERGEAVEAKGGAETGGAEPGGRQRVTAPSVRLFRIVNAQRRRGG